MGGSFKSMADMFDGGGAGRAGQRFEGGAMSDFLNDIGVKPYGYYDRMKAVRPQMRPAGLLGGGGSSGGSTGGMGAPELNNPRIRAALLSQPGMDEAIMGNDPADMTSGTPSFRERMAGLGDQIGGIGAVRPMEGQQAEAYRPEQQALQLDPINVYRSPMQAEQDFGAAPGGRSDIGTRFLYEAQRAGVAPSMDLFQKFMQTGSIR